MVFPDSGNDSASATKAASVTSVPSTHDPTRSNEELQKTIEELRRVGQHRSLFLSRLAHELRTPLTSILGFAEIMLTQEKLTEPQRSFCERIQSSAQQLQNSLNQLSDLSRLECGSATLNLEEFSLVDLINETFAALARPANKRAIELSLWVEPALPIILSDRGRLRQVLYNVLSFAISRSALHKTVSLRVVCNDDRAVISITDSGDALIEPSTLGTLEMHERLDGSELALVIARQNIQALAGVMNAHNADHGLEIQIQIPFRLPSALET